MNIRTVTLGGRQVEYSLVRRKQMKRMNVRIKPDGSVHVSAPPRLSAAYIEKFLKSNADAVLGAIDEYKAKARAAGSLCDGCTLYSLGRAFTVSLEIDPSKRRRASAREDTLTIRAADIAAAEIAASDWLDRRLREYLAEALGRYYPAVGRMGITMPAFSVKNMTSRWGSCSRRTHRLAFSTMLREYPPEAVDYVVVHELSHFIHPDHSKDFYAFVGGILPDWKRRRDMLKAPRRNCV